MIITLYYAIGKSGQFGLNGKLPWLRNNEDMALFSKEVRDVPIIMGRKTYDSLPRAFFKAREGTQTTYIVLTSRDMSNTHVRASKELSDALWICQQEGHSQVFIIGGASVLQEAREIGHQYGLVREVVTHIPYDGPADIWV